MSVLVTSAWLFFPPHPSLPRLLQGPASVAALLGSDGRQSTSVASSLHHQDCSHLPENTERERKTERKGRGSWRQERGCKGAWLVILHAFSSAAIGFSERGLVAQCKGSLPSLSLRSGLAPLRSNNSIRERAPVYAAK